MFRVCEKLSSTGNFHSLLSIRALTSSFLHKLVFTPVCLTLPCIWKPLKGSHSDVFLRELVSNANDALEKLRLTALTDKQAWDGSEPLNITIKAVKDEDGNGGRIIITGMAPSLDSSYICEVIITILYYRYWYWHVSRRAHCKPG